MTETFLFLAGLFSGISFLGGYYFYAIPFAVLCLVFSWLNRPHAREVARRTTERIEATKKSAEPARGTKFDFSSEEEEQLNKEPSTARIKRKLLAEIDNEIDAILYEALSLLNNLVPKIHSICIFFPSRRPKHYELRTYYSPSEQIMEGAQIAQNQGLVGQLVKQDISRIIEGDIPGSSTLYYYNDEVPVRSIAGVPIMVRQKRSGAVVIDSLEKHAFDSNVVSALKSFAKIIGVVTYKSYMDFEHLYQKEQLSALYNYQRKFFNNMSVNKIYGHIEEYVKDSLPFERLMILALDSPESRKGRVVRCLGKDEEFFQNTEFSLDDKGILILSFLKNLSVNRPIHDGEEIPRIKIGEHPSTGFSCLMAVPVVDSTGSVAEVICVESTRRARFSEHEQGLLNSISSVAAFALARARAYEEKQDLASRDGLTGLCNHRTFQEKLRTEMIRATRMSTSIGLLMTDIDHFKGVNDTYGHPIGDLILKEVSRLIQRELRHGVDLVARYGGEEFVAMLIDASAETLEETAERIRKAIEDKDFDIGRVDPISVTISIGYAIFPRDSNDVKDALDKADKALYKAKESGRNKVVGYR